MANRILVSRDDYGESREDLEKHWNDWLHLLPFDAPVAGSLQKLIERRIAKLDKDKDAVMYQRLERKLKLVNAKAKRYELVF